MTGPTRSDESGKIFHVLQMIGTNDAIRALELKVFGSRSSSSSNDVLTVFKQ